MILPFHCPLAWTKTLHTKNQFLLILASVSATGKERLIFSNSLVRVKWAETTTDKRVAMGSVSRSSASVPRVCGPGAGDRGTRAVSEVLCTLWPIGAIASCRARAGGENKTLEFLVCPTWRQQFPQLRRIWWAALVFSKTTLLRVVPLELSCSLQRIRTSYIRSALSLKKKYTGRQPRFFLQKLEQKKNLQNFDLSTPCFLRVSVLFSKELALFSCNIFSLWDQ